jgi:hypothetical protein
MFAGTRRRFSLLLVSCLLCALLGSWSLEFAAAQAQPAEPVIVQPLQTQQCDLQMIQCATGQWISKVPPYCDFERCNPLVCTSSDEPVKGCSGTAYSNKCSANEAADFCDDSVRLAGQSAMDLACPAHCINPIDDDCPEELLAADYSCIREKIAASETSSASEGRDEASFSEILDQLQSVLEEYENTGMSLSDMLVSRLEQLRYNRQDILQLLQEVGSELKDNVETIVQELSRNARDFDHVEIRAIVENALQQNLGVSETDIRESGIDIDALIDEARPGALEEILEENDGQRVQTVLKIPGEPLSPSVSILGDRRAVKFQQHNHTSFVTFSLKEIIEVDPYGNKVQSINIDRIVNTRSISTVGSDVNLGSSTKPKRALEAIFAYPLDYNDFQCPGNARALALDTTLPDPRVLMRVYLIGPKGIEINYLGDDVLLQPFSIKYTCEIEDWPFCDENNKLELVMDYKYSSKDEDCKVEDIEDLELPADLNIDPDEASFDAIVDENALDDLEDEMDELTEILDMEDELDEDVLEELEDVDEDFAAEEDTDNDEDSDEDEDIEEELNSYTCTSYGYGCRKRRSLQQKDDPMTAFFNSLGVGASGSSTSKIEQEIKDAMDGLPMQVKVDLATAIIKLQDESNQVELTDSELQAVRFLLRKSKRVLYRRARSYLSQEMKQRRRERLGIAASLKMMRRRLKYLQKPFRSGKVASGYGDSVMYIPGHGLMDGAKQSVDIEIQEKDDQHMEMKITFPNCGQSCIYDPTIEMTESARLVPTDDSNDLNVGQSAAFSSEDMMSLLATLLIAFTSFLLLVS